MSEVTTRPAKRATKAPTRAQSAPVTAPAAPAVPETSPITADEALVAAVLAEQLRAICDARWQEMTVYGNELLEIAIASLGDLRDGCAEFHRAAAAVYGALNSEREDRPCGPVIPELEQAFAALNSAAVSYGFSEGGCEALANGIRAGQRQFRDRPSPPIRRMEEEEPSDGYSRAQLKSALEFVAGAADSVSNILILSQSADGRREAAQLVEAAEIMVRHIGASADAAVGVTVIGNMERWTYGPNFADLGKDGAA